MRVEHYDPDTGVGEVLQDELRFPDGPLGNDPVSQYNYWAWKFEHAKNLLTQMPRKAKERQSVALIRDRAQCEVNKAKRRLFG